jgi:peptidoglycan hydrolase-like protein with peptidoglycan-binding domain
MAVRTVPSVILRLNNKDYSNTKKMQEKLIELGYSVGIDGADGEFGPNTLAAVIKF